MIISKQIKNIDNSESENENVPEIEISKDDRKKLQNIKRNIASSLINQALTFLSHQKKSRF